MFDDSYGRACRARLYRGGSDGKIIDALVVADRTLGARGERPAAAARQDRIMGGKRRQTIIRSVTLGPIAFSEVLKAVLEVCVIHFL